MVVGGEDFFRRFVTEWEAASKNESTPVWLYYRKLDKTEGRLTDSDWTPVMTMFLDLLAWKLGYVQLYERPVRGVRSWRRDCIWTVPPDTQPLVTIEAENKPDSVYGRKGEVAKLLRDVSNLKVLVTYHADDWGGLGSARAWRNDYLPRLFHEIAAVGHEVVSKGDIEFLLTLGDDVVARADDWYGFVLKRRGGAWDSDWTELKRP